LVVLFRETLDLSSPRDSRPHPYLHFETLVDLTSDVLDQVEIAQPNGGAAHNAEGDDRRQVLRLNETDDPGTKTGQRDKLLPDYGIDRIVAE
jgi:hypothetical protein